VCVTIALNFTFKYIMAEKVPRILFPHIKKAFFVHLFYLIFAARVSKSKKHLEQRRKGFLQFFLFT
tara:strand:- start:29 stop:226 length:198 start_codon:yes stop_codon:yes gene_type:complete